MREETEFRPKPMVQVGHQPILWHIMKVYAFHGVKEFVLCAGYKGNVIREHFLNYEAFSSDFTVRLGENHQVESHGFSAETDWLVTVAETGDETMTGGRVKRVEPYVDGDEFMVTYGDGLADVDITALLAFHRSHGRIATMTCARPASRFGIVEMDEDGVVEHFREKPRAEDWVNAGFFVFDRKFFEYLPGDETVLEREPLERLAKEGQLVGFRHEGFWQPMDTYREMDLLNELWDSGQAPWAVWRA